MRGTSKRAKIIQHREKAEELKINKQREELRKNLKIERGEVERARWTRGGGKRKVRKGRQDADGVVREKCSQKKRGDGEKQHPRRISRIKDTARARKRKK